MKTLHHEPIQKNALITGASRGLGLALARALAQEGWRLIIDAQGQDTLRAAAHELSELTDVISIAGDISSPVHRAALSQAVDRVQGIDALINNASYLGPSPQPELVAYPLETLERVYQVNVFAPLALFQAVYSSLKDAAVVINISSDAGVEAYSGWGGYGSSKAALEQLSAIMAAENPKFRIYWVDPGDMKTQMHQEAFPGEDISDRPQPEASVPGLMALILGDLPSGRYQARQLVPEAQS
jgi:NAD(P)-dependent dehydrogenase (short-subunit alcohol dehydrogenase family)